MGCKLHYDPRKAQNPYSPATDNDDNKDVCAWAQAHGVNVIPNDNDNDANEVAPVVDANDKDVVVPQDEDYNNEDKAVVQPMPATWNKTL